MYAYRRRNVVNNKAVDRAPYFVYGSEKDNGAIMALHIYVYDQFTSAATWR